MSNLKIFNKQLTAVNTQEYLNNVLGNRKSSFTNNLVALVSNSEALQACEPMSIMFAGLKATALELPLDQNLGYAYVIPYKQRDKPSMAQFQIGAKGFHQLAIRSGLFKSFNTTDVREGEYKGEDRLTGEYNFEFKTSEERNKLKIIGYVSHMSLLNGFSKSLYMTIEEIDDHGKKYSKSFAYKSSPWNTDREAMREKTVSKRILSKYAPLSVEMKEAIQYDQGVIVDENTVEYIDNQPETIEEKKEKLKEKKGAKPEMA